MDRFDLYGALYLACRRWHSGQYSRGYRILSRLARLGYRPGITLREMSGFESPAQASLYRHLLRHYRHAL